MLETSIIKMTKVALLHPLLHIFAIVLLLPSRTNYCFAVKQQIKTNCESVIDEGQITLFRSYSCLGNDERFGNRLYLSSPCNGIKQQSFTICDDETIRNKETNLCLGIRKQRKQTNDDMTGNDIKFYSCYGSDGAIADTEKWNVRKLIKGEFKQGRVTQAKLQFNSVKYPEECITERFGTRHIYFKSAICSTTESNDRKDLFYIRKIGKRLFNGRILNEQNGLSDKPELLCLTKKYRMMKHLEGKNIDTFAFEGCSPTESKQIFEYYENGEVRFKDEILGTLCLSQVEDDDSYSELQLKECDGREKSLWDYNFCNGLKCSFINMQSKECINVDETEVVEGTKLKNPTLSPCKINHPDHTFEWRNGKFARPSASFVKVGCNQNGKLSLEIANEVSYTHAEEMNVGAEVSLSFEAGVVFLGGSEISTTLSTSLTDSWEQGRERTTKILMGCEINEDGTPFTGGCLWQMKVEMKDFKYGEKFEWLPQNVVCTRDESPPKCPPFNKCANSECSKCITVPSKTTSTSTSSPPPPPPPPSPPSPAVHISSTPIPPTPRIAKNKAKKISVKKMLRNNNTS